MCNGSCKIACFLIFENAKKIHRYLCCLAKMAFNKSHLGMIKCPEGKGMGKAAPMPLFWRHPCPADCTAGTNF